MRRFFIYFFSLLCLIIIATVVIGSMLWMRVPGILSKTMTEKLGVETQLADASLGWDQITLTHLLIMNPSGSMLPRAFSCQTININNALPNYLKEHIVIETIYLKDIYLGLEFESASGTKGNWTKIMSHLQRSQDMSKTDKEVSKRTLLIRKIILENINVDVAYQQQGNIKHLPTIDRLEFTDISSEGGFPTEQIMNSVLGQMLKSVFIQENLQDMLKDFLQNGKTPLDSFVKPFRGLFGMQEDSLPPAI